MQFVVLSMLLGGPLSSYDLRSRFADVVSLFYSASLGSIQRALTVLDDQGFIESRRDQASSRGRKAHSITPAGRAAWREWMLSPVTGAGAERTMLARVFYLGQLSDPSDRAAVVATVRDRVEVDEANLRRLSGSATASPAAHYQLATLDYGLRTLTLARHWLDELAEELDR
ncbi:helix-turn-helix transcriptional regulator [Herbiconiux sp. UC225_62]|uniref:helix-turn-helix transcriptional regulator n=1 Tax=Herbiconiux sp. UC225_62 TaxID=3350168 RepID=UPI0036D2E2CE